MNGKRYILAGSLIDGIGTVVRKNVFLEIEKGIITAIGAQAHLPPNDGTQLDDFSHCTLLPAFIDCSVSLSRSPSVDLRVQSTTRKASLSDKTGMLEKHLSYCHAYGVLGVADGDTTSVLLKRYQEQRQQGHKIEIRTSNHACLSKQDQASCASREHFIKINYSGNIDDRDTTHPLLNHDSLRRILQQKGKQKSIVKANGPQQVQEAIAAGCDAIEQGYAMGEDNLRNMAEKGILWIPSIILAKNGLDSSGSSGDVCCRFSQRYVAPGKPMPGAEDFWRKVLSEQLSQLRLAKTLGITTAIGTGAGSVGILHGESMAEEMKLFQKAGYSLEEIIQCASENSAKFFGMKKLGALAVGRNATFLITRGTVQQLPRKLSYLEGIYIDGTPSISYCKT